MRGFADSSTDLSAGGGEGGIWSAVNLVWEIWRLAAMSPTPGASSQRLVLCVLHVYALFLASAKFPTAKFSTAKLTRHRPCVPGQWTTVSANRR